MKKKIIFISLFFILAGAFLGLNSLILTARAQDLSNTLTGLNETAGKVTAFQAQAQSSQKYDSTWFSSKVGTIISVILSFVGVIFFILIIYAGISWMISEGNEQKVTEAKKLMINAIIGLVIVFAAYAIVSFLGTNVLNPATTS